MKNKTIGLIAGGVAGIFALAAWSFYPENRASVANWLENAGIEAGVFDPPPTPPVPALRYIEAGYKGAEAPAYMAELSAQGCSADGKVMRLAYAATIVSDGQEAEIMGQPGVGNNKERYLERRRDDIAKAIQGKFQVEATGMQANRDAGSFDLSAGKYGEIMQAWLEDRAEEIHQQHGLKIAIRVNAALGLQITPPRQDAIDACTPEGHVPEPLLNARGPGQEGPKPF